MFEKFLSYVDYEGQTSFPNEEAFYAALNGKSFKNGIYRIFAKQDRKKWGKIVEEAFPKYSGLIDVFGYDWLGRIFAINKTKGTVLLFEPGTGEVLSTPASFVDFHDIEIAEYPNDSLASIKMVN